MARDVLTYQEVRICNEHPKAFVNRVRALAGDRKNDPRMRQNGGWIGVVCPDPAMARIVSITGLDRMFPVGKSVADLLARSATLVGGGSSRRPAGQPEDRLRAAAMRPFRS